MHFAEILQHIENMNLKKALGLNNSFPSSQNISSDFHTIPPLGKSLRLYRYPSPKEP